MKVQKLDGGGVVVQIDEEDGKQIRAAANRMVREEVDRHTEHDMHRFQKSVVEDEIIVRNSIRGLIALDNLRFKAGDKETMHIVETAKTLALEHQMWKYIEEQKQQQKEKDKQP